MTRTHTAPGKLATGLAVAAMTGLVVALLASPARSSAGAASAASVPACEDCRANKDICYWASDETQKSCYSSLFDFYQYQCSVLRRDVFGRALNPRKYECERKKVDGKETRVCHGPSVDECLDEVAKGLPLDKIARHIYTTPSELAARLRKDPTLTWTLSQGITGVKESNIFEGLAASCTHMARRLAMRCGSDYDYCVTDVARKRASGECR